MSKPLKCLKCQMPISLIGNTELSDSLVADVTCPKCGQKHYCDMVGESVVLTLPLSLKQQAFGWALLILCVAIALIFRGVLAP